MLRRIETCGSQHLHLLQTLELLSEALKCPRPMPRVVDVGYEDTAFDRSWKGRQSILIDAAMPLSAAHDVHHEERIEVVCARESLAQLYYLIDLLKIFDLTLAIETIFPMAVDH